MAHVKGKDIVEPKKGCSILVVDDEAEFVEYVETLLRRQGYGHTSFSDSRRALEFFSTHSESVDIIVSDIRMPGIDGIELARRAARIKKDISIILVSGYSEKLVEGSSLPNVKALLDKPVTKADLLKAIESVAETYARH